jgi:hypothetical protein
MERIENPMLIDRPEDNVDLSCHNCGDDNAMNDVEIVVPDKKSNDYFDAVVYYCDECYNKLFED